MRRDIRWQIWLGLILIVLSAAVYLLHFLFFRDLHHILLYLVGDIAFVFIEVLLVTLIIHELLQYREKRALLQKMNMVIGAFFSEMGLELMRRFAECDSSAEALAKRLKVSSQWSERNFEETKRGVLSHKAAIHLTLEEVASLKAYFVEKRYFLLGLLQNPNLLEHETFTDLLWALFHFADELAHRSDIKGLPASDLAHLTGDVERAWRLLIAEWLEYMRHLKSDYPYLFSINLRLNPFDKEAAITVR